MGRVLPYALVVAFILSSASAEAAAEIAPIPLSLPVSLGQPEDCSTGEVHDDGDPEGDLAGDPVYQSDFRVVDRFTPASYPFRYEAVCIGLIGGQLGETLHFTIQVYDDDGPGSGPGTLLGEVGAQATDISPGPLTWRFHRFDISALEINLSSGSVFIGVRWNPIQEGILVGVPYDGISAYPPVEGFYWYQNDWVPSSTIVDDGVYVALMVRATGPSGAIAIPTLQDSTLVLLAMVLAVLGAVLIRRRGLRKRPHEAN